ncbi:MAG: ATP-binding protein [Caldilineales bacterium]|nr:ATP-binding protein [Caldilineales bacterium]MDW8316509.1 ATP-binding protein [Anaerolineae bacterium]
MDFHTDTGFDAEFDALPRASSALRAPAAARRLGVVVGGSLSEGLEVRLDREVSTEELAVGTYVVVRGRHRRFFSMITDVRLGAISDEVVLHPPDLEDDFLAEVHVGTSTFGLLHLSPMLELDAAGGGDLRPVKTVPGHFSEVRAATQEEVSEVFGREGYDRSRDTHFFHVGEPLDMENVKVTLSLERLVERSSGVFGKSGTGKTFLSRILLAGVIRDGVASNLIFDMHNEYGWEGTSEGPGRKAKGLKQLFPGRVAIFTLDPESSRRRQSNVDFAITIGYDEVEPEDLEMLQGILNLSEPQMGAIYALRRRLGPAWLSRFLDDDWIEQQGIEDPETGRSESGLKVLADSMGQTYQTLAALHRRLERFRRYGFLTPGRGNDAVDRILRYLDAQKNVVLEFGRYGNQLDAYIFVANFLTRRIHQRYVEKKEAAFGNRSAEPQPLVITIEEAHKFLDPSIAGHTIFGTIARELRKYNVTLLVVDQRPSQIDPEVMSQIGTRVTALLDNEEDIRAVLMGVSGAAGLREVLARLDTRQQALILGHAVPMPVVVRTRAYDAAFFREMGFTDEEELPRRLEENRRRMRGDEGFEGFD